MRTGDDPVSGGYPCGNFQYRNGIFLQFPSGTAPGAAAAATENGTPSEGRNFLWKYGTYGSFGFHWEKAGGTALFFLNQVSSRLREYPDKSFQQVFQEEVKENLKQSALSAKDKEALMQMGAFLGYLDKDMQLRTVELYLEELDREIQTAKESIPGKQRLCRSLGILGGLFLVLLLI